MPTMHCNKDVLPHSDSWVSYILDHHDSLRSKPILAGGYSYRAIREENLTLYVEGVRMKNLGRGNTVS